ncbi:MAG: hypothetical protein ACYC4T_14560 [Melioribacteraceae bacterium]
MIKKNLREFILASVIIAAVVSFAGCSCNCGKKSSEQNYVKGYITVVGNEPFTKLAVKTGDDKIYILQCSKELKDQLWKQQGSFYYILYGDLHKEEGDTAIVVEKVIPVTKGDI